jgi:hypothetical protein
LTFIFFKKFGTEIYDFSYSLLPKTGKIDVTELITLRQVSDIVCVGWGEGPILFSFILSLCSSVERYKCFVRFFLVENYLIIYLGPLYFSKIIFRFNGVTIFYRSYLYYSIRTQRGRPPQLHLTSQQSPRPGSPLPAPRPQSPPPRLSSPRDLARGHNPRRSALLAPRSTPPLLLIYQTKQLEQTKMSLEEAKLEMVTLQ